ncbi:L domain-like protein [Fragilariopsis cylindrus CCMP1102]|uniref:L domain-like protein n=1 Tax=Fragilariopsis cylindrus CCMP1102 TaxID=635003 RepID=A0A1E7F229_9STRA|nr:L domain-like protein [Fragilariopsis cylindrus CCMP1102]|eukprot:OEU12166.1 L domain-like protein [Fragilariopsis cylindrus CCMP1102]
MAVFYYATNGDDWLQCSLDGSDKCGSNPPFNSKQRFLSDISECDWAGITCNMDDCVTRIEFESNNITGTIATEIGLLKDLVFLGMEDGGLTSTIPTELGGLTNLSIIDFDYNELSGSIPAQLYLLTDLVQLDLNDNELTGNIDDIGVFLDLEFLQLQNNQFTGTIPDDIMGDLSRMRVLNLHGNMLDTTQAMPESVCARLFENGGFLTSLIVDCGITCSCCTSCLDKE